MGSLFITLHNLSTIVDGSSICVVKGRLPMASKAMSEVARIEPSLELPVSAGDCPVAYPGGFSGCPDTPQAIICFNQGVIPVTGTDHHQPLTFATFGNPP